MTIIEWLKNNPAGINLPERRLILAHIMHRAPEWILAHTAARLSPHIVHHARILLRQRAHGTPLAYLIGSKEFYGHTFTVTKHVLIPRPETEYVIEAVRNLNEFQISNFKLEIVDVGTGSGCIAITLAKLLPHARITATDISPTALRVARKNARYHGVSQRVKFIQTDLLPTRSRPDIIVANLPYLTTAEWRALPPHIKNFEPRRALDGGRNGTRHYHELFAQIKTIGTLPIIVLEIDPRRARSLTRRAQKYFPHSMISTKKDLAGHDRVLMIVISQSRSRSRSGQL